MAPSFFDAAREIVSRQQIARDNFRTGVSWSGLQPDAPEVETVEDVALRLEREAANRTQFRLSPRGRFYVAIEDLREAGFHDEAQRLYGFFSRSIRDEREPLNVQAVAACLVILDGITVSTARTAQAALHELLLGERPVMLAAE
jgi:hypothetical protein